MAERAALTVSAVMPAFEPSAKLEIVDGGRWMCVGEWCIGGECIDYSYTTGMVGKGFVGRTNNCLSICLRGGAEQDRAACNYQICKDFSGLWGRRSVNIGSRGFEHCRNVKNIPFLKATSPLALFPL